MVTGVSTLVALLEKTGGMTLFTDLLARLASPRTLDGVIAFVTGAISLYSSTSGVVLPAFLPTVPGLVHRVGCGDPLAVALSINVGSSLVDVSPLSTIGALCVAAVPEESEARVLFLSGHPGVDGEPDPGAALLQKPVSPDALARRVREVLDAAPAGALQ